MRAVNWKDLVRVCEEEGYALDRQKGDHYIMTKSGSPRPVVIPRKRDLKEDIVLGIARTIGLTKKEMLDRLEPRKKKNR